MSTRFKLEINDFGKINSANIEINRINVVGGINASGKTTASKLLYCFLKANTLKIEEYLTFAITYKLDILEHTLKDNIFTENNNLKTVIQEYEKIKKSYNGFFKKKSKGEHIFETIDSLIKELNEHNSDNISVSCAISSLLYKESLRNFTNENKSNSFTSNSYVKFYNNYFKSIIHNNFENEYNWDDNELLYFTEGLLEKIPDIFYIGAISIFDLDKYYTPLKDMRKKTFEYEEHIEYLIKNLEEINEYTNELFEQLKIQYKSKWNFNDEDDELINKLSLNLNITAQEVMDKVRIECDGELIEKTDSKIKRLLRIAPNNRDEMYEQRSKEWRKTVNELNEPFVGNQESVELKTNKYPNEYIENQEITELEEKFENIIQGKFRNDSNYKFSFSSSKDRCDINTVNISSGIKQIGILQLLLKNNKLKRGTFLIIDEPEINLHPEWQFKFAEILVLLAKELDITIYINSHSPMFIESIQAFTEYYDMENEVNYYLTEKSENKGKYNFNTIKNDELYKLYDNLGNPYDLIDQLRLEKRLGE